MRALGVALIVLWSMAFAQEKQVLDLWYHVSTPEDQRFFEAQVERFNKSNPNIRVKTLVLPQSAFTNFVYKEAKEGQLPDLLYFQSGSLSSFVWSNMLRNLNPLVSADVMAKVPESVMQQSTYPVDGGVYSLSPVSQALTLYGNKTLLQQAGVRIPEGASDPWSLSEFHDGLAALNKAGLKWPLDMQLYHADDEWYLTAFVPFIQASGGDIISRTKWDAHIALESLFMNDVAGIIGPMLENDWIVPSHKASLRFERRRAGLALAQSADYKQFAEALGDELVVIPFPVLGPHHVTSNSSWSFGVTQQSKAPAAAAKYIEFVMSDAEVLAASEQTLGVPATTTALAKSPYFGPGSALEVAALQFQSLARPKPLHPAYPVIREALADSLDDILAGTDFKIALSAAADKIDADIAANNHYPPFDDL